MSTPIFAFELFVENGASTVRLRIGEETAVAPFQVELRSPSRLKRVLDELAEGTATFDTLRDVGSQLFFGLVNGPVADLFTRGVGASEQHAGPRSDEAHIALRLALPPDLQPLPWECLYDEQRTGFLFNTSRFSLIREVTGIAARPRVAPPTLPVSMLVVIPEGSGLSVEREWHGLTVAVGRLGAAIDLHRIDGRVSPDVLRRRIDSRQWDIVHFIGHGDTVDGLARVRINDDNQESEGTWLPGEAFATFFARRVPRLVVLNSCLGGSHSPQRTLSGIAPFLLRAGIPAVVAMQYEIPDEVAIRFASSFYAELLSGFGCGRVDLALAETRRALSQNSGQVVHSFVMPVLYLTREHETLFDVPARLEQAPPRSPVVSIDRTPNSSLPAELVEALRDCRCIPVIGADIVHMGALRSAAPPPGPRELARQLAVDSRYPQMDDFAPSDRIADLESLSLLPRVCQHYESRHERYKLLMTVQKAYKDFAPSAGAEAIAAWDFPGIICAYFDGHIEEAMTRRHRRFRSVSGIDEKLAGYRGEPLVVHLRGIFKDGESLVLTERDHELLWDRMAKVSSNITDLTRKRVGLTLLYIGVSPRDPLIRRLTQALRGGGSRHAMLATQGPMYFACTSHDEVDEAYWRPHNVHWLPMKTQDIVTAVGQVASLVAPRV